VTPLPALAAAVPATGQGWAGHPAAVVVAVAALSLLPFVVLLMTSFVKIAVVLAILKSAFGAAQIPPSQVITGLALILTLFVMAPTAERMVRAVEPELGPSAGAELLSAGGMAALFGAAEKAKEPLRDFLLRHASPRERGMFHALALRMRTPAERATVSDRDFLVVVPAFLASELRRAFEVGLLVFLPFLVIDRVIANLLVALGLHALSPTAVSLPFKLLLFLAADGWQILLRGLVAGYA
jgi:type III secretion protein R